MDLISRQAAIEELSYCQTFLYDSMDKYPKIELGDAKAVLEALPTAEPIGELIRCRDCKHFHENVWGNEIGLDDLPIIVGHEACDAWGNEWTQSCADGYCHMAERRSDE